MRRTMTYRMERGVLVAGLMVSGCLTWAVPSVPKGDIPTDTPPGLREQIEKLYSRDKLERAGALMRLCYIVKGVDSAPAVPFLLGMLHSDVAFPTRLLFISSRAPRTSRCTEGDTFGGRAAEALASIGIRTDELPALLKDRDWRIRSNAVRALGGLKDERALQPMMAMLADRKEHPVVRGSVALALGALEDRSAVDPLMDALKDEDPRVRRAAASSLGQFGAPRSIKPLIAAFKDKDAQVRMQICGSLGRSEDPSTFDTILRALQDEHRQVRVVATRSMDYAPDDVAVDALIAALDDPYVNVQINAAAALGERRNPRAIEPLIRLLVDDESATRQAAAQALGLFNNQRAREALTRTKEQQSRN